MDNFTISLDKICFLIERAHELEVKVPETDPDSGSNPTDDLDVDVLEARQDDPIYGQLESFFESLNDDEALDLVVLMWIGRGTYDVEEWEEARDVAAKEATHSTSDYLLGSPLLAEHLEDGLEAFGLTCGD